MRLEDLNTLPTDRAIAALRRCCGSTRWATLMTAARPFVTLDAALERADAVWSSLAPDDWLEAFHGHPRIGENTRAEKAGTAGRARKAGGAGEAGDARAAAWSDQEQAGVRLADNIVRDRLAEANRDYEARFGYIFIVCATGKSAEEMLAMLERRLTSDPDTERRTAAEEQRKITRLRLAKLVTP
jgi:OHCU decarboxylase